VCKTQNLHYTYAQVSFGLQADFFSQCAGLPQTSSLAFLRFTTEIHRGRPLRLVENTYLVASKVGMIRTYSNKNEEQPKGFPEKF